MHRLFNRAFQVVTWHWHNPAGNHLRKGKRCPEHYEEPKPLRRWDRKLEKGTIMVEWFNQQQLRVRATLFVIVLLTLSLAATTVITVAICNVWDCS